MNYWNLFQVLFHNHLFIPFHGARLRHSDVTALPSINEQHHIEFKSMLFRLYCIYICIQYWITHEVWKLIRFFWLIRNLKCWFFNKYLIHILLTLCIIFCEIYHEITHNLLSSYWKKYICIESLLDYQLLHMGWNRQGI